MSAGASAATVVATASEDSWTEAEVAVLLTHDPIVNVVYSVVSGASWMRAISVGIGNYVIHIALTGAITSM